MRHTLLLCAALTAPTLAHAQSFDVASVRLSPPNHGYFTVMPPGPRFSARTITLTLLISMAYADDTDNIVAPPWANETYYDVEAETESAQRLTQQQLRPYLQNLLKERFALTLHRESRASSGFFLVADDTGPKLKPAQDTAAKGYILPGRLMVWNEHLAVLARMLQGTLHLPVEDHTNLTGNYDVDLKFAPDNATDSTAPALPTALHEQLGLHLEPHKITQQFLIVDHAERVPTEN